MNSNSGRGVLIKYDIVVLMIVFFFLLFGKVVNTLYTHQKSEFEFSVTKFKSSKTNVPLNCKREENILGRNHVVRS